jgi:hypothetical protein
MPLELAVWRIDGVLRSIPQESLDLEQRLEDILDKDISIANPGWMIIGRQVDTGLGPRADLLAIDEAGNLVVLELKRDQTPRDVVAQVLEYGAWVTKLRSEDIPPIYKSYLERYHTDRIGESFDQAFCRRFRLKELPEDLNSSHELVIVASQFDAHSERIVTYLSEDHDVSINAIFFRVFKDGDREYLSRVWLRDPSEVEADSEAKAAGEWNGEYYVSFGGGRNWEEARRYGFISGGGGPFYSRTLNMLSPGDRVWVNIPGTGYVGVGRVTERVVPIEQFNVAGTDGKPIPICDVAGLDIAKSTKSINDIDAAEYLVRVRWDKTVPVAHAIKERGLFGVQHTVARPKDKKWVHTVERLRTRFGISDQAHSIRN